MPSQGLSAHTASLSSPLVKMKQVTNVNSLLISGYWILDSHRHCELNVYVVVWLLSHVRLFCNPRDQSAHQSPLSMRSPRQEYKSGSPFPSPGDLPDPEVKLASPPWQVDSLPLSHLGSPKHLYNNYHCCCYYYSYYLNRNYHFFYFHYRPPFIMNWILF